MQHVEIAGPGFLNLTFADAFLAEQLAGVAADERLGRRAVAETPKRVVVDYSAPNVAKEMHVGHLRTTVIGDALVRLLTFVGHTVIRENHIGDWGTPFGMLIEHLVDIGETEAAAELSRRRPRRLLQAGPGQVRRRPRVPGPRPRGASCCCRAATPRRCGCGSCSST